MSSHNNSSSTTNNNNRVAGIDPKIWGAAGWKFIRSIVVGWDFENQDPKKLCEFVKVLPHVLPCDKCRHNFEAVIQKYPVEPYIAKRELPKWYNEVREMVRQHEDPKSPSHSTNGGGSQRQYADLFVDEQDDGLIHIPDHVRNRKKNQIVFLINLCLTVGCIFL